MGENKGIIAGGGANVVGSAVASGRKSKAAVRDSGLTQAAGATQPSPQEIRELLGRLVDGLAQSGHAERADLIEAAEDARAELASATPRTGKLKVIASALSAAVAGMAPLASLAVSIEQAVKGL